MTGPGPAPRTPGSIIKAPNAEEPEESSTPRLVAVRAAESAWTTRHAPAKSVWMSALKCSPLGGEIPMRSTACPAIALLDTIATVRPSATSAERASRRPASGVDGAG
ncbi:hypothetical protein AB9M10_03330 [Rhodococcus erythropolis]